MAKIVSIEEVKFETSDKYEKHSGFCVKLSNGEEVRLWLDMFPGCCESFGYFLSEDNFSDYIGAELFSVERVNKALSTLKVEYQKEISSDALDYGDVMFVNLNTSNGVLQFVAYNQHNGYYGHSAGYVTWNDSYTTTL